MPVHRYALAILDTSLIGPLENQIGSELIHWIPGSFQSVFMGTIVK